jgi:hypothetical protein
MNVCTRCGATNQPTSKFCLSCGNPLAAAAAPPPVYGAPQPAPAPQAPAAAPPAWGQQPPAAAPPQYAPPPAAQPWQQPPPAAAGFGAPQPGWNPGPQDQGGFAAPPADRARFGTPEGMNPFGATVGPDFGGGAAQPQAYAPPPQAAPQGAYGPPPAPPQYAPPPAQAYAPPPAQAYAPPPAQAYAPPPAQAYAPPPAQAYAPPAQAYALPPAQAYAPPPQAAPQWAPPTPAPAQPSHDPSAFAATSPPPTIDEYENQVRRSQAPVGPNPSAPPMAAAPPAVALGPGRDPELVEAGAIRALAGFLVSFDQNELGVFWPLYQGQNVLGRKGAAPGLDIEIDSPTTSSRHAVVYASARPGRLKVEDGGSTNGTFLNDTQLERGKKFELRDNDVLRLGGFNVTVKVI